MRESAHSIMATEVRNGFKNPSSMPGQGLNPLSYR